MKQTYQLIKLKTATVKNLKRLLTQTGQRSLDDLINSLQEAEQEELYHDTD